MELLAACARRLSRSLTPIGRALRLLAGLTGAIGAVALAMVPAR